MVAEGWDVVGGTLLTEGTDRRGCLLGVLGEAGPSAGVLEPGSVSAAGLLCVGGEWVKVLATCGGMAVPGIKIS